MVMRVDGDCYLKYPFLRGLLVPSARRSSLGGQRSVGGFGISWDPNGRGLGSGGSGL